MLNAYYVNETLISYSFGTSISLHTSETILKLYTYVKHSLNYQQYHILDIVPTYTSLSIYFTHESVLFNDLHALDDIILNALKKNTPLPSTKHTIYVDYHGEDMHHVCTELQLSINELIALHTQKEYTIAMLGFKPYFSYLLGLDEKLFIPRKATPKARVKKGSVAIANGQTGIYSEDSPGGWNIIGYTSFNDFTSFSPADIICFKDINESELP